MSIDSTISERMTSEPELTAPKRGFVPAFLPWVIAACGLCVYLATFNHWLSLFNLQPVARLSGWGWQPNVFEPLYWLITYPLHWLPQGLIPPAVNLLSVFFAVLTLALLARSVALLPHDRTHEQRQREQNPFALLSIRAAWLPPVLAVVVCGLQLTFWENATVASAEMLNQLLFAYVIRCLLEFRVDARESWLTRAAFVYGLGMTNNWAMIGFFPIFLAALIWIRGLSFFNVSFLSRMFVFGLAGLMLYLLLPLIQSRAEFVPLSFWQSLKANLGSQVGILAMYFKSARQTVALLSLTSLVPILVISIRWASSFGDTSQIGIALATIMFHIVHALFLAACIWISFDPPVSPRHNSFGPPFLTFYYLGALTVGYTSGYFLLVFRDKFQRSRRTPGYMRLLNTSATVVVGLLLVLVPVVLISRNLPQMRLTNGSLFADLGHLMTQAFPAKGGVILSDDPRRLWVAQAATAEKGQGKNFIFLDTASLEYPDYHRFLRKQFGARWPLDVPKGFNRRIDPGSLTRLLFKLSETEEIYYLHPSFGYYFEYFYLEPHGLVYKVIPYSTNFLVAPISSKEIVAENQDFWNRVDASILGPLVKAMAPPPRKASADLMGLFAQKAHLLPEPNRSATILSGVYSRALNTWGAEEQRQGTLEQAGMHFERALQLNADNVVARINLDCNRNLRSGGKTSIAMTKSVEEAFGRYRNWNDVMSDNGPFDEPTFCYEQGNLFINGKLYRQAMAEFQRVVELDPAHALGHLGLAKLNVLFQHPDEALQQAQAIHGLEKASTLTSTNQTELLFVEVAAHLQKKELPAADGVIEEALKKFSNTNQDLLATAGQVYMKFGLFTNAAQLIDRQLQLAPDNIQALINKGFVCLQLGAYDQAIAPLDHVLTLQKTNATARLNRAIAYLRTGQLEAAQEDYETLRKSAPTAYPIFYGLGDIAYHKRDTNAAIRNYELYLSNAPPILDELKVVTNRLAELQPGRR